MIPRATAAVGVTAAVLLLGAPAASAHVLHGGAAPTAWTDVLGRTVAGGVLVSATLLLGGLLASGAVMGRKVPRVRKANLVLALLAVAADLLVLAASGSSLAKLFTPWPARLAGIHLLLSVVILFGWNQPFEHRLPRLLEGAAGSVLVGLVSVADHPKLGAAGALARLAISALHLESAAVWSGAVLLLLLDQGAAERARRLGYLGLTSATVTVVTGLVYVPLHLPDVSVLPRTAYGRVLMAKIAGAVAVAVIGAAAHRWRSRRRVRPGHKRLIAAEAGAMTAVLALAATLTGLPASAASPPSDSSPLTTTNVGGRIISVVVTPDRPGPNLVQVAGVGAGAPAAWFGGGRRLSFQPDDGAGEWSALTQLGTGTLRLHLVIGGRTKDVAIRVPPRTHDEIPLGESTELIGDDRAECLSQHVGRLAAVAEANRAGQGPFVLTPNLSDARDLIGVCGASGMTAATHAELAGVPVFGAPTGTPVSEGLALEAGPAALGQVYGRELARSGVRRVALISDTSLRSSAFIGGLRLQLSRAGIADLAFDPQRLPVGGLAGCDVAVLATDWSNTRVVLSRITNARSAPERGVFVAPWLLDQGLLGEALDRGGREVVVGVPESPQSPIALQYLNALARYAPGEVPSFAGLEGYFEARMALDQFADRKPLSSPDEQADLATALAALRGVAVARTIDEGVNDAPAFPELQFFTPARISFLPAGLDTGHSGHDLPSFIDGGGNLAAVSGLYPVDG